MAYYMSKTVGLDFDRAVSALIKALKDEGFGILADIDVQAQLKDKLAVDFRKYRILGACDPEAAYKALQVEDKIGALLPCNVIVQETPAGPVEIAAMDPAANMDNVRGRAASLIARSVRDRLASALANVPGGP